MTIYNFAYIHATGAASPEQRMGSQCPGAGRNDRPHQHDHHHQQQQPSQQQKRQLYAGMGSSSSSPYGSSSFTTGTCRQEVLDGDDDAMYESGPSAKRCRVDSNGSDISFSSTTTSSSSFVSSWQPQISSSWSSHAATTATTAGGHAVTASSSSSSQSPIRLHGPFPAASNDSYFAEQLD